MSGNTIRLTPLYLPEVGVSYPHDAVCARPGNSPLQGLTSPAGRGSTAGEIRPCSRLISFRSGGARPGNSALQGLDITAGEHGRGTRASTRGTSPAGGEARREFRPVIGLTSTRGAGSPTAGNSACSSG